MSESISLISQDRLDVIADCVRSTAGVPGDMAELGVYRGGSAKVILGATESHEARRFYLIDTFKGLPWDGGDHHKGEFSATSTEAWDTIKSNPNWIRSFFVKGIFPDSALGLSFHDFSFVHIDADLYESTRDAIAFFWPKMFPGGIMVFDDVDWPSCPGVNQAIEESGLMPRIERRAKYQGVLRK